MDNDSQGCPTPVRRAPRRGVLRWVAAIACLMTPALGAADSTNSATIESVRVGFDGYYQLGRWSPIHVDVRSAEGSDLSVVVIVTDPDGHPTRRFLDTSEEDGDASLGTGTRRWTGLFRMGRLLQPIQVQLLDGDEIVDTYTVRADDSESNRPLTTASSMWLLIGQTEIFQNIPAWLEEAAEDTESTIQREVVTVHSSDLTLIPDYAEAFQSLDVVVIGDQFALTSMQSDALRDWVADGGRLLVSIGSRLAAYQTSPLAEWIPLAVDRQHVITSLGPLTSVVASNVGISFFGRIVGASLPAEGNQVLVEGSEGPLIVRTAYGFGTVTASAFDLDNPVVVEWEHAPEMALNLVGLRDLSLLRSSSESEANNAIGISVSELQTQLATAIDQYDGVDPITNFTVLGFLVVYLVVIGLLDFFIVHRTLKRPHLTWVTLPVWLLFGILFTSAYGRSHSNTGDQARRVALIDVAGDTGSVRVHDWLALYSAQPQRQDIRESVDADWIGNSDMSLSWSGLPESGFRGMFRQAGLSFGEPAYAYDGQTQGIAGFPRLPNASRVLEGQAMLIAPHLVESSLEDDGLGQLSGTFTHHLPEPITDWFIAYRNIVYYPLDGMPIPPGVEFSTTGFPHPVIKYYLTRSGARRNDSNESDRANAGLTLTGYDTSSDADISEILRMVSFYEAADGKNHTGLDHRYLARLEMTPLLDLHRAVVFGRIAQDVVSMHIDGEPTEADSVTYVRLVIPVEGP